MTRGTFEQEKQLFLYPDQAQGIFETGANLQLNLGIYIFWEEFYLGSLKKVIRIGPRGMQISTETYSLGARAELSQEHDQPGCSQ
jgi:hypothetical protein